MSAKVRPLMVLSGLLAAACVDNVTGPPGALCLANYSALALAVGDFVALDPIPTQGCVIFPANGSSTDSAEYLLVPQATTEVPNLSTTFRLTGQTAATALIAARQAGYAAAAAASVSPAERFHSLLREMERTRTYPGLSGAQAPFPTAAPAAPVRVSVGDHRAFMVLASITKGGYTTVNATAQSVGQHVAIFVDDVVPAGGLTTTDIDALRDAFEQRLYPADTVAFGRESDIDGNGLVIVLMTGVVNKLVTATQCQTTGYVAGFFFGADIDPATAYVVNDGEVFYTMVPDPSGTLSCNHSIAQVKRVVPGTLIHEFQHMISYNHHVLQQPPAARKAEVLWLNEALSHYAEELGGRAYLPDTATFCNYIEGDLNNAAGYLSASGSHPLVDTSGLGGLEERGAGWLFVRYLVDQLATDTSTAAQGVVTRQLDNTALTGTNNVAQLTGVSWATTAGAWALALWASDLPGFTAKPSLRYKKWAFRTAYPKLSAYCGSLNPPIPIPSTFPLSATAVPGTGVNVSGTMIAGSGATYQRALQGLSGAKFDVLFSDPTGGQLKATVLPRLNVLRIR
ncbi:MAG TPA: hypothetical protein VLV16_05215 [Gemmatimonadales bacterium]|nr:hypothetical protein [Gemmatimonadales bacterium]